MPGVPGDAKNLYYITWFRRSEVENSFYCRMIQNDLVSGLFYSWFAMFQVCNVLLYNSFPGHWSFLASCIKVPVCSSIAASSYLPSSQIPSWLGWTWTPTRSAGPCRFRPLVGGMSAWSLGAHNWLEYLSGSLVGLFGWSLMFWFKV